VKIRRPHQPQTTTRSQPKTKQLVSLKEALRLLGGPKLEPDDFDWDRARGITTNPCTEKQRKALTVSFRVDVPEQMPFHVARKVIGLLVERLTSTADLCVLWQISKLCNEFGWTPAEARVLSYDDAMFAIDDELAARGKTYKGKRP
jgi:hypothetical protein